MPQTKHFKVLHQLLFIVIASGIIFSTRNCYDTRNKVIIQLKGITLNGCVTECRLTTRCTAIRYKQQLLHCSLLENDFVNISSDTGPYCLYTDRHTWYLESSVCNINDCNQNERCVVNNNSISGYTCEAVLCSEPYEIANSYIVSQSYSLGSVLMYKCKPGFTGIGDRSIVCQRNGSWSNPSFECVKTCPRPSMDTTRARLIKVKVQNNFGPETVITYGCKPGFHFQGIFGSALSYECLVSGQWEQSGKIQCCLPEHYSVFGLCYLPYQRDIQQTSNEIRQHCNNVGGWWAGIWHPKAVDIASRFDNVTEILSATNKTAIEKQWNLEQCLIEFYGNQSIDEALTTTEIRQLTFDETVRYIKENNIAGSGFTDCKEANNWAPGQPDGGDQEFCVYSKKLENGWFKWFDYNCALLSNRQAVFACGFSRDNI